MRKSGMIVRTIFVCALFVLPSALFAQIDATALSPAGYHPGYIAYWDTPYFANAVYNGAFWMEFYGFEWGTVVDLDSPQFDPNGYPQYLLAGQKLRAPIYGLHSDSQSVRPPGWPQRQSLASGHIVLTWQGNADVRFGSGNFVAAESSGGETGILNNGRRVYLAGPGQWSQVIEVHAIDTPITEIRVWLADPDNPTEASLEGELFHPLLLERLADADWAFIRMMDWGHTNQSPQQDWIDRRRPSHIFMDGIRNRRAPADGFDGDRPTGVAFETMVMLANASGKDLWINIPHLASDDFITKLAQLLRYGSDGSNPYTSAVANPVYPPLDPALRVWIEFSNEIWSNGNSFPQGDWAQQQAALLGLTKQQFTARRFCDSWRIFQAVFGGTARLVRVAAVWTGMDSYTVPFLEEIGAYGPTLSPPVRPDVMALTTYFGNGIQDFVYEQGFTDGLLYTDPYWQSDQFEADLTTTFGEWRRRMLSGDASRGGGPDATSFGGGFPATYRTLPDEVLGYPLPIVAYEGGPSLYTDMYDHDATNGDGVQTDDHVTIFVEQMNRDPRIAEVYRIHLEMARSKGLRTHSPFTDSNVWGKYGQWGHLEQLDQDPADSPKYSLMVEHATSTIHHIDDVVGSAPIFTTGAILPAAIVGQPVAYEIETSGGDGKRIAAVIGTFLDPGLTVSSLTGAPDRLLVSGVPTLSQRNYIQARVVDADGDPAWRIFTLQAFGGPGTLVESDFRGTNPAFNLPWTPTYVLAPVVTWSGWNIGAPPDGNGGGVYTHEGDDEILFSVAAGSVDDDTLADAIAENQYLVCTITPVGGPIDLRGAEVRFSTRQLDYHAARGYAFFSSIGGFGEANALYVSTLADKGDPVEREHTLTLPSSAAFSAVSTPLELRIYAFSARWGGHRSALTAFKLTGAVNGILPPIASWISPRRGSAGGGTAVTLSGGFFASNAAIHVGGVVASVLEVEGPNAIVFSTPALAPGALHDVVVENPGGGSSTLFGAWMSDFLDVGGSNPFRPFIESIVRASITAGCGGGNYCPGGAVTRAQMAVFLLRAKYGPGYAPPPATGTVFNDVSAGSFAAAWIEQLAAEGVTGGCGGGNYCPSSPVTRAQMAVFLLRTLEGNYVPPDPTGLFADVPVTSPFARWIEELSRRGITAGCGNGNYCPSSPNSRAQMAVFLSVTFALP